jgi:hypothetical protein
VSHWIVKAVAWYNTKRRGTMVNNPLFMVALASLKLFIYFYVWVARILLDRKETAALQRGDLYHTTLFYYFRFCSINSKQAFSSSRSIGKAEQQCPSLLTHGNKLKRKRSCSPNSAQHFRQQHKISE